VFTGLDRSYPDESDALVLAVYGLKKKPVRPTASVL